MLTRASCWFVVLMLSCVSPVLAAPPDAPTAKGEDELAPPPDAKVVRARELFEEGIAHVKVHEWGKALIAFEQSTALRPHAVTSYNIGACQRAMGRYTRARAAFDTALQRHRDNQELPPNLVADSERYLAEINRLLVTLRLHIEPPDARVAIDGAPLAPPSTNTQSTKTQSAKPPRLVAGVRESGAGEKLPARKVEVVLDPGAHVMLMSRKGFNDVAINKTFPPGSKPKLTLKLDLLPGQLRITADVSKAMVELDGHAVGLAPVSLQQPAGTYSVTVQAPDHEPYETRIDVQPGEEVTLRATLPERNPSIVERWWFWTAAGVVVTGAVIGTYFATRPDPERPALNGGGLGWTVPIE
jgi:hypothetical protein